MSNNDQKVDADKANHKTCLECSAYLPASYNEFTEFGICLNDDTFEPFAEELLTGPIPDSCQALVEQKKFVGELHSTCPDFQPLESFEIDDNSRLGQRLRSLSEKGELTPETLEAALFEERVNQIDWKTQPVARYIRELESDDPNVRDKAISSLSALIALENHEAFLTLFRFLANLPPPTSIKEVHLKIDILGKLGAVRHRELIAPYLIQELGRTTSDNTTRQWILEILRILERCPLEAIKEPLEQVLAQRQFSYRLKRRIQDLISDSEG